MANLTWHVPLLHFPKVAELHNRCATCSRSGDMVGLHEAMEQLRSIPGFPYNMTPDDHVTILPKEATVQVSTPGPPNSTN
jgi:hypothetical protein